MLSHSVFLLLYLVVGGYFIYFHWKRRKLYKLAAKIPGPTAFPLIGSAYLFLSLTDIIQNLLEIFDRWGSIIKVWLFHVLVISISDPNHIQIVLNGCLDKDIRYNFGKDIFGNSVLLVNGKIWKNHRKIINPAFNQKILDSFMDVFTKQNAILIQQLNQKIGKNEMFDVYEYLGPCSLDIICGATQKLQKLMNYSRAKYKFGNFWVAPRTYCIFVIFAESAMGISVEAQTKFSEFLHATKRAEQLVIERVVRVWLHPDFIFRLSKRGRELAANLKIAHDFTGKLVTKRYNEFHSQQEQPEFQENEKKPLLEHLLTLGDLSFLELRHEVDLFILAATDTISTTAGHSLVCLGMYKEIQEKVIEELVEIFGTTDRQITLEDLPKLVYLERVIKETMRLYPPAPFIARSVTEDTDLGDYVLPEGSSVLISIIRTHRNPKIWPNPMKFDPDRFLPEEVAKRHPCSFIPFSAGPRVCLGTRFAMMSLKIMLSTILRNYKIDTNIRPENIRLSVEIVSKLIGGANISITKR